MADPNHAPADAFACSLSDEELAVRRDQWRALERRALVSSEARPGGRQLVYRGGEAFATVLRALIEAERECCPFLDFTIDTDGDEVRLTVGIAPQARPVAIELGLLPPPA